MAQGLNKYLGLLRWSLQYSDGTTTNAQPMEEERRKWLMAALEDGVVDPVDQIKSILKVLETPEQEEEHRSSAEKRTSFLEASATALSELIDFAENIDWARDVVKIGGVPIVLRHLQGDHESLRRLSAEVIAALAQNNDELQGQLLEQGSLEALVVNFKAKDCSDAEKVKLLLGMSCLIRGSPAGTKAFVKDHKGVPLLLQSIGTTDTKDWTQAQLKLTRKAVFLLRYILFAVPQIRPVIADSLVSAIAPLTTAGDIDLRESTLTLLEQVLTDSASRQRMETKKELQAMLGDYTTKVGVDKDDHSAVLAAKIVQLCQQGGSAGQEAGAADSETVLTKEEPVKLLKASAAN